MKFIRNIRVPRIRNIYPPCTLRPAHVAQIADIICRACGVRAIAWQYDFWLSHFW